MVVWFRGSMFGVQCRAWENGAANLPLNEHAKLLKVWDGGDEKELFGVLRLPWLDYRNDIPLGCAVFDEK
jgi:hypothetical protein